uniref:Uncharacterized protein n=1 Tax=Siphoviridae sp. ctqED62 TaxID=2826468 RepID=A0A8S5MRG3_9CAUD|nr:MAG TPA: hypothetical protein [Siphoviridae sp. ctqED62]
MIRAPVFLLSYRQKGEPFMGVFQSFNPNPLAEKVGDCAVRAIAKALGIGWYQSYVELVNEGLTQCDMPSANNVWGAVLRRHGFQRAAIPAECPDCYTVGDFIRQNPKGTYVVALKNHVVTVVDGVLYDTWNSMDENPIYFWRRE